MVDRREYEAYVSEVVEKDHARFMGELVGCCEICDGSGITQNAVGRYEAEEGVVKAMCETHRGMFGVEVGR